MCGLDPACWVAVGVDGLLTWVVSLLTLNTVFVFWLGAFVGAWFGWPAFMAATFGLATFWRRKPDVGHPVDVQDEDPRPIRTPAKTGKRPTIFDGFKGLLARNR